MAKAKAAKKGAKTTRPAARPKKAKAAAKKPVARTSSASSRPVLQRPSASGSKSSGPRSAAVFHAERKHCIATDPFGDPCQTSPRYGSKYCAAHSHLDH